ncbi:hypothetical protein T484DRAFT_1758117, partial [Baffinella frigidus]
EAVKQYEEDQDDRLYVDSSEAFLSEEAARANGLWEEYEEDLNGLWEEYEEDFGKNTKKIDLSTKETVKQYEQDQADRLYVGSPEVEKEYEEDINHMTEETFLQCEQIRIDRNHAASLEAKEEYERRRAWEIWLEGLKEEDEIDFDRVYAESPEAEGGTRRRYDVTYV